MAFWTRHPETEASLRHWHGVAVAADWRGPLDVLADFPKAKSINGERVRFEVSALLAERIRGRLAGLGTKELDAVLSGDVTASEVADELFSERVGA